MRKIKQIEEDVIELYSLLHQRYVISEGGLDAMVGLQQLGVDNWEKETLCCNE